MISESHETPRKVKRKVQVVVFTRTPAVRVLLLRRPPERGGIWQPVTGNVDPGDGSLLDAARRELTEETGIREVRSFRDTGVDFRFRTPRADVVERLLSAETSGVMDITLSDEHVESDWLPPDRALERLRWETNRDGVRQAIEAAIGQSPA